MPENQENQGQQGNQGQAGNNPQGETQSQGAQGGQGFTGQEGGGQSQWQNPKADDSGQSPSQPSGISGAATQPALAEDETGDPGRTPGKAEGEDNEGGGTNF